ncbi:MAG: NAD+ synthase [Gemmatimonadota bacterium]|nr:NAD+ synthase [Gemmatimonadota bacterium]
MTVSTETHHPMHQGHSSAPLSVGLAQVKPVKGDVPANLEHIRTLVSGHAEARDVDVLLCPEACLSGYFLEGGVAEAALTVDELREGLGQPPADAPDLAVGFYERWNRRTYNSAAYLEPTPEGWDVRHVHRKMFLPTYGVFDEGRFVEAGAGVEAFDTRFGRFGLLICEDAWHSLPGTILAVGGAELILVPSASPSRGFAPEREGRPGNLARWDQLAPAMAMEHGLFVAVAQLAGSEGGKVFPGGSVAVDPGGEVLGRGPLYDEGVTITHMDAGAIQRARAATPLLSDLEKMLPRLERSLQRAHARAEQRHGATEPLQPSDPPLNGRMGARVGPGRAPVEYVSSLDLDLPLVRETLVEFIREEVRRRRGFERVVVGVSGGVDSAVSLFLACEALGPENVYGLRLPYRTSSQDSLDHASLALDATGAQTRTIDISDPIDRYVAQHEPDITPTRKGNLMARMRAVVLFDQSAKLDALPLGTGNKSERLLGYFTWHADDSPPINPIGDLFKTQVWALARHLEIPDVIVDKPATADLVQGVDDEDELGISYHAADPILHALLQGHRRQDLAEIGFDPEAVDLVWKRLNATHWKRELPTVAVLSSTAIGAFYLRPVDY